MQVLRFLNEHKLALPQGVIFRNLRYHYGITFGYSSVDNYLDQFVEEGLCRRVDPQKLEDRETADLPQGADKKGYYVITEKGRNRLENTQPDF